MIVPLSSPISVSGAQVAAIELRPPGRRFFEVMRSDRGPIRFSDEAIVRIAARLSVHGPSTIRKLSDADLAQLADGIEQVYAHARRRFVGRSTREQDL